LRPNTGYFRRGIGLRDRREDISLLAAHFLRQHSEHYRKAINGFDEGAIKALLEQDQPAVTRAAAASYIASFVSRAQFVDREGARDLGFGAISSLSSAETAAINRCVILV